MAAPADIQNELDSAALPPPPGINSNFVNPENIQVVIITILALCVSISTLVFGMRMYTKFFIFHKTGWEDYIALLAWLLYVGFCVPCILVVQTNGGVHQWDLRLRDLIQVLYYINIAWIMYGIVIALVKLSLLLQYLKFFVPIRNYSFMVLLTYLVIWSTSIFYLITTFFEIFPCTPREMFWNRLITNGHCFNINAVNITSAAINCFSDFVILLLPQGVIWRLQMPFRRKLGVSAIFLTGFFACITSIMRIYYAIRILQTGEMTYNFVVLGLWSHAEITFGIICSCLPVLPRFFLALRPKILMLLKPFVQTKTISKGFRLSPFSVKRGEAGSSGCTGKGPYELQHSAVTSSVPDTNGRSLVPTVEDPTMGFESVEGGLNTNRIIKTVHIETVQEPRDDPDLDIERQPSINAW